MFSRHKKSVSCSSQKSAHDLMTHYHLLLKKQQQFGRSLPAKRIEQLFAVINSIAMQRAQQGYLASAQEWLHKSQKYAENYPKLAIILHSNMACIFKKRKNYCQALTHLRKVEQKIKQCFEADLMDSHQQDKAISECFLNICAVRSSMEQHQAALAEVRKAVGILELHAKNGQEYFIESFLIAKYNEGVQLEHLDKLSFAHKAYSEAIKFIAKQHLNGKLKIQNKIIKAAKQIKEKMIKSGIKRERQHQVRTVSSQTSCFGTRKNSVKVTYKETLAQQYSSVFTDKCFPVTLQQIVGCSQPKYKQVKVRRQNLKENVGSIEGAIKIKFKEPPTRQMGIKRRIMMSMDPN